MNHSKEYFQQISQTIVELNLDSIERVREELLGVRRREGRIFFLGVGGSAANASHAVNDFRKIGGFEAYAATENVAELTARINDDGWESSFVGWLQGSRLNENDLVFVFSVGGGSKLSNVSVNLVHAIDYALQKGARICGIVGRDGGYTATAAHACIIVPVNSAHLVTPIAESFQAILWHLLVSDPSIQLAKTKWEEVSETGNVFDNVTSD